VKNMGKNVYLNKGNLLIAVKKPFRISKDDFSFIGLANPFKMNVKQALGFEKRPKGSFKMKNFWTGR